MPHGFNNPGGHEKPQDDRDILLGAAAPAAYTFPKAAANASAWMAPVEYQRDQPACGAHAGAELKGLALKGRYTPRFTWADIKMFDGFPIEQGTDMRSIFKSITKAGALDFEMMGNDTMLSLDIYAHPAITPIMRSIAERHAGMGYGFLSDFTFSGLKQFIYSHGPTIVLLKIGREWWTTPTGATSWAENDILPLLPPSPIVSGHFVLAHSYDERYIYFLNSWSSDWGRKGHGFFGENYMPFVRDAGALFPLTFKKDLFYGMTDPDVIDLQRYLNSHGCRVAVIGSGSPGNETDYFGELTRLALAKFQAMNGIVPSIGFCGPLTRAFMTAHA